MKTGHYYCLKVLYWLKRVINRHGEDRFIAAVVALTLMIEILALGQGVRFALIINGVIMISAIASLIWIFNWSGNFQARG